jgi:putative transposase
VQANQADANKAMCLRSACKALQISKSGYYEWRDRAPCKRAVANIALSQQIKEVHTMSDETYGMPRIRAELLDLGQRVGKNRIARLMRLAGLHGVSRRRGFAVTTKRDKNSKAAPDLVHRQFKATALNQLWVADMTYIPTWQGFTYLAVVTDVFSRRVVGWQFGDHMTSDLVIDALNMAHSQRNANGVIHHSDQGSQYTSVAFGERCKVLGVRPSMGTVGDAYDNAMAESFFATLECELINRRKWETKREAKMAIFTWLETWYNSRRRHSALGYQSPINFERRWASSKPSANESPLPDGLTTVCFAAMDNSPYAPSGRCELTTAKHGG